MKIWAFLIFNWFKQTLLSVCETFCFCWLNIQVLKIIDTMFCSLCVCIPKTYNPMYSVFCFVQCCCGFMYLLQNDSNILWFLLWGVFRLFWGLNWLWKFSLVKKWLQQKTKYHWSSFYFFGYALRKSESKVPSTEKKKSFSITFTGSI